MVAGLGRLSWKHILSNNIYRKSWQTKEFLQDEPVLFYVLPTPFKNEVAKGFNKDTVARILSESGMLKKPAHGKGWQVKTPRLKHLNNAQPWTYVLLFTPSCVKKKLNNNVIFHCLSCLRACWIATGLTDTSESFMDWPRLALSSNHWSAWPIGYAVIDCFRLSITVYWSFFWIG